MTSFHPHRPPLPTPSINSSIPPTKHQQYSLAKRLLLPNSSDNLPPLLISPNASPELNAELYDLIALSLRAFVNPWWFKITRYDKEFLPQIAHIFNILTPALEARILALDLTPLVFHDLPAVITQHFRDYRNASSKISTSYAGGGAVPLPHFFHQLQPHLAILPDGSLNHEYYRQIVDHILKVCLPPEDYRPEAERIIIREIILKVLLNDAIPRVSQPWFIQRVILDLLGTSRGQTYQEPRPHTSSFSIHNLLVIVLSALQGFSTACLALIATYKQAVSTIKLVNQSPPRTPHPPSQKPPSSDSTKTTDSRAPPSIPVQTLDTSPPISATSSTSSTFQPPLSTCVSLPPQDQAPTQPNYAQPLLIMLSEIFCMYDRFASTTIMTTCSVLAVSFLPFIDKLLHFTLAGMLSPAFILASVRLAKQTVFPNGYLTPVSPDPTSEEQADIQARLIAWRGSGITTLILPILLGSDPSLTLARVLEPLSNQQCNMHLVVVILDRIFGGLFPELVMDNE